MYTSKHELRPFSLCKFLKHIKIKPKLKQNIEAAQCVIPYKQNVNDSVFYPNFIIAIVGLFVVSQECF